jgi:hypothetical protein
MEPLTVLLSLDGRRRVQCVTITDAPEGWWARPVGAAVRFFFQRSEYRYED